MRDAYAPSPDARRSHLYGSQDPKSQDAGRKQARRDGKISHDLEICISWRLSSSASGLLKNAFYVLCSTVEKGGDGEERERENK